MTTNVTIICPRCGRGVRRVNDLNALSRTDNVTMVCESCGTAEAFEQFGGALTPQSEWFWTPGGAA